MRKLSVLLLLITVSKIQAQFFSGEIIINDKSVYYLNQVFVTNLSSQKTIYTDYFGSFKIPAKPGDVIRFTSIVTERKDITVTPVQLQTEKNFVELNVAYYDIQEVVIKNFKPTGNLQKDVTSLKNGEQALALQKMIGLPSPKGNGLPPELPLVGLAGGGLTFSLESIYDLLSGERKKKERAQKYEQMASGIGKIRQYYGDAYFTGLKIPADLIDNFLEFVYTSDDLSHFIKSDNFEAVSVYIEKYLPIYQRRLRNSMLMNEERPR